MGLGPLVFRKVPTQEYPRDVGGQKPAYEPTYFSTPGKHQSWYRVTKCRCGFKACRFWAVVNVYNGLQAGRYFGWDKAIMAAVLYNTGAGAVRPDPKWRIR